MKKIEIEIPDDSILVQDGDKYVIKRVNRPRTWEEFCERYPVTSNEYFINGCDSCIYECTGYPRNAKADKNYCTSEEEAEAFLALMQLRQLRKAWVGDWNPSGDNFYAIIFSIETGLKIGEYASTYRALSFPTPEMAREFLDYFKDLCEKAKILL